MRSARWIVSLLCRVWSEVYADNVLVKETQRTTVEESGWIVFNWPILDCFRVNIVSSSIANECNGTLLDDVSCRYVLDEWARTNCIDSSSKSVSSASTARRLSLVLMLLLLLFFFFFWRLCSSRCSSSLSMETLIVGICRSRCSKGGLLGDGCFRRRENFRACRTFTQLCQVVSDDEP